MNTPNDFVKMSIARNYIENRLEYEDTRQKIKQAKTSKPSRFYCGVCHALVHMGHVFVAFGRRLERFDLVLRDSQV